MEKGVGGGGCGGSLVLMAVAVLVLENVLLTGGCPSDCICKWKGGKQWVECVSRNLRTFPPSIDPGSQVLDMSGNSFETLPPDHFMRSGLINLQKIFLSKCRLSHINSRAFRGLSNLVELDLGNNLLRDVPSPAFPDTPGLMRLVLSGNPISVLGKRAFVTLESLNTLELSSTGLELIELGAFEGLHALEWLKLDGNRLKGVRGLSILPLGLKGLSLEDNPWECDCHLLELRLWLSDRNVANSAEPRCAGPDRVANGTIRSLPPEAFACFPQLSPTTMFQKIGEGKNVSLLCKVLSVPESSLEWLFNGQPLTNASLNLLVETTSAYVPTGSSSLLMTSSGSSAPSLVTPVEKKSELLILNATSDENGTFLCLARNPAGAALANFTLRVLSRYEGYDPSGGGGVGGDFPGLGGFGAFPQLVTNYPNLFIIVLSTVAVIGLLLVLAAFSFLICKCGRCCFGRRRSHGRGESGSGSIKQSKGDHVGSNGGSGLGGHKLDRNGLNLSDASTLTTNTKKSSNTTNGSVFLLSSSSQGDSNPDLIEGVALNASLRGDGDGLDSAIYNSNNHPQFEPHLYYHVPPHPGHTHARLLSPAFPSSPSFHPDVNQGQGQGQQGQPRSWPLDFGLPYSTPPPPQSSSCLPGNYDLSKYPKEYISPQSQQSQQPHPTYEYTVSPVIYSDYPPTSGFLSYHPHHHPHYPGGGGGTGNEHHHNSLNPNNPNCSCGPILEGNETEEDPGNTNTNTTSSTFTSESAPGAGPTTTKQTKTASTSPLLRSSKERLNSVGGSMKSSPGGGTTLGGSALGGGNISKKSGLLRSMGGCDPSPHPHPQQLVQQQQQQQQQINESPDEGYEDGGAEGTEI